MLPMLQRREWIKDVNTRWQCEITDTEPVQSVCLVYTLVLTAVCIPNKALVEFILSQQMMMFVCPFFFFSCRDCLVLADGVG